MLFVADQSLHPTRSARWQCENLTCVPPSPTTHRFIYIESVHDVVSLAVRTRPKLLEKHLHLAQGSSVQRDDRNARDERDRALLSKADAREAALRRIEAFRRLVQRSARGPDLLRELEPADLHT